MSTTPNEIEIEKHFTKRGDFKAYNAATKWLTDNGYSYGSTQRGAPSAIFKGDCSISKWRNLSKEERESVDGLIIGQFREGPLKVLIFKR